jgi:hypothetical protein
VRLDQVAQLLTGKGKNLLTALLKRRDFGFMLCLSS